MSGPAPASRTDSAPPTENPLPAEAETGKGDGLLDSLGKAIASPIKGAAEAEEPGRDSQKPPVAPG